MPFWFSKEFLNSDYLLVDLHSPAEPAITRAIHTTRFVMRDRLAVMVTVIMSLFLIMYDLREKSITGKNCKRKMKRDNIGDFKKGLYKPVRAHFALLSALAAW